MIIKTALATALLAVVTANPATAPAGITNDAAEFVGVRIEGLKMTPKLARNYVRWQAKLHGYTKKQWQCLDEILWTESRYIWNADNPWTTAFGLFQIIDLDPSTKVTKQTQRGLRYIKHRYGTACVALAFHHKNGWY